MPKVVAAAEPVLVRCPKCRFEVTSVIPKSPLRAKLVCPDPKCGREFILVVSQEGGMGFSSAWRVVAGFTPKQAARNERRAPGPDGLPPEDWAGLDGLTLEALDQYVEARTSFYYGMSAYYEEAAGRLRAYRGQRKNQALSIVAARKDREYVEGLRAKEAAARRAAQEKAGVVTDTVAGKVRKVRKDAPPVNLDVLRSTLQLSLSAFEAAGLVPKAEADRLRSECNSLAGIDRLAKRLGMPTLAQAR